MKYASVALIVLALPVVSQAQNRKQPELFEVSVIRSSWDDLTERSSEVGPAPTGRYADVMRSAGGNRPYA